MEVIPVINCPDVECARQKIEILKTFLPAGAFVHLDVTDGVFAAHKTWNDSAGWTALQSPFALEVHVMAMRPGEFAAPWLAAGAKRLIVHVEALGGSATGAPPSKEDKNVLDDLLQKCAERDAELMLALSPKTPIDAAAPFLGVQKIGRFQILAVPPGPAGQEFLPAAVEKVKAVRALAGSGAIIEVDGGMNPETARLVKEAGANVIVSADYIFGSADPSRAYEDLAGI